MEDLLSTRDWLSAVAALALLGTEAAAQAFPTELDENLRWENLGPFRGGRSTAVAGSDARPYEYYFGATGGGLWKSTDGGTTWSNVTDHKISSASIGAVQVCAANPDVVCIGTGETQFHGNVQQGDGVYRSDDAEIREQGDGVKDKLGDVGAEIYQLRNASQQDPLNFIIKINNKLAALLNGVSRGDFPPTEQSRQVFARLDGLLQEEMVRLQLIIEPDLARLNELLREEGLDPILVRRLIS